MKQPATPLAGAGEMARRVQATDWSRTPLGPREQWPPALRAAVDICLHSRFPIFIWWGPQLVNLYNDAYIPILGARHPAALGALAPQVWAEVWDVARPQVEAVLQRGEATWNERVRLVLERHGHPEEAFFTWSYSPIRDDTGQVGGLLCIVTEETQRVHTEAALADARRRLDSALIAGEVGTFEWDVVADRLWGDANFARLFNIRLDAQGAAPLQDYLAVIHPDDRARVAARVQRTLETGQAYEAEYRIVSGGEPRWVVARGKGERDASGRIVRFPGVVLDVTTRKRAEESRRASEQKYRALFESMDEGFCIIEVLFDEHERPVDYRFLETNPAFVRHTGLMAAEGRRMRELVPDHDAHWFEIYGRVARTGVPERFEQSAKALGRDYDVYAFRIGMPEERQVAVLFQDVSEQKRTEVALVESRERFRAVLDSSLDAAYRRDLRTDSYDYLSPVVEQVLGISPEQMRSMPVEAFLARIHPDDLEGVRRAVEAGMRARRGRVEYRLRGEAGDYRWLADYFTVQADESGAPATRTGIVRDVTDEKRTQEEIRQARQRLETVITSITDGFLVLDRDWRYTYFSETGARMLGVRADEMIGGVVWELFPHARGTAFYQEYHRAVETGQPVHFEEYYPAPLDKWLECHCYPSSEGLSVFFRDVTERKHAEAERERLFREAEAARREAEAANRAKADFLAAMSHELRTPLNAIGGYVELLDLGIHGPISEAQQAALARITANQRHLLTLISDILQFARLEAGQVEFELRRLGAHALLQSVEPLVAPLAAAKGVAYSVQGCHPALQFLGDEERVCQVVLNLVTNAIKFTPGGGRVVLSCDADEARVHLRVRDSGVGIAPEKHEAIFDPFVQVDRRLNRPHDGVGLGLAISRDLARGMGGELSVQSAPGEGSTFTLSLPAVPPLPGPEPLAPLIPALER